MNRMSDGEIEQVLKIAERHYAVGISQYTDVALLLSISASNLIIVELLQRLLEKPEKSQ